MARPAAYRSELAALASPGGAQLQDVGSSCSGLQQSASTRPAPTWLLWRTSPLQATP